MAKDSVTLNGFGGGLNLDADETDVISSGQGEDEVSYIQGINEKGFINKIKIVPKGAVCKNYAFDVTPSKYITMLITEKGNIKANTESISKIKN